MAENKYYARNAYLTFAANKKKAQTTLKNAWESMTDTEKASWSANSQFNSEEVMDDPTGYHEFRDYYMGEFGSGTNSNSSLFSSVALGTGSGNDFSDRVSRIWTSV